jgi:hypothetical protein
MQHILLVLIFLIIGLKTSNGQCFKHVYEYDYDANGNRTSRLYHVISPCRGEFIEDDIDLIAEEHVESITVFKVFPNPSSGRFTVELQFAEGVDSKGFEILLLESTGKLIYRSAVLDVQTFFDISNMPGGTYIVAVTGDGRTMKSFKISKI